MDTITNSFCDSAMRRPSDREAVEKNSLVVKELLTSWVLQLLKGILRAVNVKTEDLDGLGKKEVEYLLLNCDLLLQTFFQPLKKSLLALGAHSNPVARLLAGCQPHPKKGCELRAQANKNNLEDFGKLGMEDDETRAVLQVECSQILKSFNELLEKLPEYLHPKLFTLTKSVRSNNPKLNDLLHFLPRFRAQDDKIMNSAGFSAIRKRLQDSAGTNTPIYISNLQEVAKLRYIVEYELALFGQVIACCTRGAKICAKMESSGAPL